MHAHRNLLELTGTFLAGLPSTGIEWSLQVTSGQAVVRDRVIFWAGQHGSPDNHRAFARVGAFLRALGAPEEILAIQSSLAPNSIRQGIGLVLNDAQYSETCLYIHHLDHDSGREHCDAWKWRATENAAHSFYEFHFLPFTPDGTAPIELIHSDLRPLFRSLEADQRVRAISGFWLRHRNGGIDQISLTYPWQPAVGDLAPAIQGLMPLSETAGHDLRAWYGHHFRHIAMNAPDAAEPSLTFYFSGDMRGRWPMDAAGMREHVRQSACAAGTAIERIFARLPPPPAVRIAACSAGVRDVQGDQDMLARLASDLTDSIRPEASVYVIGCGWGAVSTFLSQSLRCRVAGITDDREQYAYCAARGLRTRYGRPEETMPPGRFDYILVLDGIDHIPDAASYLETLRIFGERILVKTSADRIRELELDTAAA